jgi:hypothetical protein
MLKVLNDPAQPNSRKDAMAIAAAPFLHSRLSAVQLTGADGGPIKHSIDLTKFTDDELATFERLMSKSQVPLIKKVEDGVEVYTPQGHEDEDEEAA